MHDSYTPIGGMVPLVNIAVGEIIFGGVGSGLYGILLFVVVAMFIAGLMVGRTPEYLGKKLEAKEVKMAILAILIVPLSILSFTALAAVLPVGLAGPANAGPHGFSEILYAFTSGTGNNGSAFAGLSANTPFYNTTIGLAMLIGRFLIIVPVLAVAGSLVRKKIVPVSAGTFPTDSGLFVGLVCGVIVIEGALVFFPALSSVLSSSISRCWPALSLIQAANPWKSATKCANHSPPFWIRRSFCRRSDSRSSSWIRALMIKNPVMFVVEIVAVTHHRDLPAAIADGRRRTPRLHLPDHPLAVGDRTVRQLRRGGGGRPRQGAGGDAASGAHRDDGEAAAAWFQRPIRLAWPL